MTEEVKRPLRIGIWAAVSSREQAGDDKASIPDQIAAGERFAAAVGAQVVARYVVPGHTRDLVLWTEAEESMPAYRQYREDVQAGRIDVLHVVDEDRLGRDPALSAQVISLLEKRGGEVYAADTPHTIGSKTISHRYISAIKGVRAAEDQSLRKYRHESGMRGRVLKRGLAPFRWPIGYTAIRDATGHTVGAVQNEQAGAVRMITGLFLSGYSVREIARQMDAGPYRPPRGSEWSTTTIRRIMDSDIYAGRPSYRGERLAEPSPHFPAIWDDATYAAIVAERQRRAKGPYTRHGAGPYTGVAHCARCGHRMYRWQHASNHTLHYLGCSLHAFKKRCHRNCISERKVTARLARVLAALTNPAILDATLAGLDSGGQERALRDDRDRAARHAAELAEQRLRMAHALAAGQMAADIYYKVDQGLAGQLVAEQGRVTDLSQALEALPDVDARRDAVLTLARNFGAMVKTLEAAQVSKLLQAAGIAVWIDGGEVVRVTVG